MAAHQQVLADRGFLECLDRQQQIGGDIQFA
jgi:hypothetical protein